MEFRQSILARAGAWLLGLDDLRPGPVLLVAALLGFVHGAVIAPTLLQSVHYGYLASGGLPLPANHPEFDYVTRAFSLTGISIPAFLLSNGAPIFALCVILSGAQAALSFSAVSAWTLALSRSGVLALAMPLLLARLGLSGHKYPVSYPLSQYDPGPIGFFVALLALGLIALRRLRIAAFLAGLMPGVHPVWALGTWLVVGLTLVASGRRRLRGLRRCLAPFLVGLALAGCALLTHWVQRPEPLAAPIEEVTALTRGYLLNWDTHRRSILIDSTEPTRALRFFESDLWVVLLSLALVYWLPGALPRGRPALLLGLCGSTAVVVTLVLIEAAAGESFPGALKMLIASRLLNGNALLYPVLVVSGLAYLALRRGSVAAGGILIALTAGVATGLVSRPTLFRYSWSGLRPLTPSWDLDGLAFPVATLALLILAAHYPDQPPASSRRPVALATALGLLLVAAHQFSTFSGVAYWRWQYSSPNDLVGSPDERVVIEQARGRPGLLAVGPNALLWPQLRTGRPVLLDANMIEYLTYLPELAPATETVLSRVYGTSLLNSRLFQEVGDRWWYRTPANWQRIRARFGVTDVLVRSDWRLNLPQVARSRTLALYHIPEGSIVDTEAK